MRRFAAKHSNACQAAMQSGFGVESEPIFHSPAAHAWTITRLQHRWARVGWARSSTLRPRRRGFFYIDHDQRDTLTTGGEATLPWRVWMATNINYGSGFLDLNGPQHLPQHTTADLSMGKSWRESWTFTVTVLNVANSRYLLGRDSAFIGTL